MDTCTATRADPLESLNAEQRLAVEHGVGAGRADTRPLLIIAGAGSGKTNTLAHRVAHLMLHQADPQRLLLLTFSRRASVWTSPSPSTTAATLKTCWVWCVMTWGCHPATSGLRKRALVCRSIRACSTARSRCCSLKSQAVLFRTSSHSAALELELTRRQIPFVKFGGLKFLEAAHVKDMLAILRFAQNPRGRMAGFRVLQLIPGIGPAHATRLLQAMDVAADPCAALDDFQVPANAAAPWQAFVQLYRALRHPGNVWPADMDLAKRWYGPHLERLHLLVPHRFYVTQQSAMGDRHLYAARSRFIPDALAAQFDTQVWPLAAAQIASSRGTGTATLQVRDRARAAWR